MVTPDWEAIAERLNECEYLFLRSIAESEELRLTLRVEEARVMSLLAKPPSHSLPEVAALYTDARPIASDDKCRLFELVFDYPVSYTVLNETYSRFPEAPEVFTGKLFREFSWSHLLQLTRKTSYASDEHPGPGPLRHFEVVCLNHVVDVITTAAPEIRPLQKA